MTRIVLSTARSPDKSRHQPPKAACLLDKTIGLYGVSLFLSQPLVPAARENLRIVSPGVPLDTVLPYLDDRNRAALEDSASRDGLVRCWAMAEAMRSRFNRMNPDDLVLFATKGTGLFEYRAYVVNKVVSRELGRALPWPYSPSTPWSLIYFINDVKPVQMNKRRVLTSLGYSEKDQLPGIRRVNDEALRRVRRQYGSVDSFLDSMEGQSEEVRHESPPPTPKVQEPVRRTIVPSITAPPEFEALINHVKMLRNDAGHQERAHESLVGMFYELLGYTRFTEIKHRQGSIDVSVEQAGSTVVVTEVKRDWGLTRQDHKVVFQGQQYALKCGAPSVVVTNGDYYAVFDRRKGLRLADQFVGEFALTDLR